MQIWENRISKPQIDTWKWRPSWELVKNNIITMILVITLFFQIMIIINLLLSIMYKRSERRLELVRFLVNQTHGEASQKKQKPEYKIGWSEFRFFLEIAKDPRRGEPEEAKA